MEFIDIQMREALENFKYFVKKMIYVIIFYLFIITLSIVICAFSSNSFINMLLLISFIYSVLKIYFTYKYYINIINEIKNTIKIDFNFEVVNRILKYSR